MQLLLDDNDFKNPNGLRFIAHFLCSAADSMDGGMLVPSINGEGKPIELTPAQPPGEGPTIDPHPADGIDPASVFAKAPSVPTGTTQDPPTGAAPPAPVGNVSSGAAAATLTPAAPAQGAPATAATDTKSPVGAPGHIDKDGLPWDARVHSDTRKLNADGTWRLRRNLDPAVKAAVYAELKGAPKAPTAPPAPPATGTAPPAPASTVVPPAPTTALPVSNGVPMGMPNPPDARVVPVASFRELMTKINQNLAAGRLSQAQLNQACAEVGAGSITELTAQPSLVAPMDAAINRFLGAPTPPA